MMNELLKEKKKICSINSVDTYKISICIPAYPYAYSQCQTLKLPKKYSMSTGTEITKKERLSLNSLNLTYILIFSSQILNDICGAFLGDQPFVFHGQ